MPNSRFKPQRALLLATRVLFTFTLVVAWPTAAISAGSLTSVVSGLNSPVFVTHAPGISDRLYIVEQGSDGTALIKVFNQVNDTVSTFLAVSGLTTGGESGLLGLAFHPDVASNGFFYVYKSIPGDGDHVSSIVRYSLANPDVADPASAFPIWSFTQPYSNHNGGWLGFDIHSGASFLCIATGDGGSAGDPQNRAQDITNQPLGKILRVDVDTDDFPADPNRNYGIPPSNPFVGTTGDDEIWAYGLRNPWRNSFDRATGDLYIGDVGQSGREEVNFEHADSAGGLNFGWKVMEGSLCYDNSQSGGNPPCFDASFTSPVYDYERGTGNSQGYTVIGGYVYRGPEACNQRKYFFADYINDRIWSVEVDRATGQMIEGSFEDWTSALLPDVGSLDGITSFGEDESGNLYVVAAGPGRVYRIGFDCPSSVDPTVGTGGKVFLEAFPNPTGQETVFRYKLDQDGFVGINIFDVRGRLVRKLYEIDQVAGSHVKKWDGRDDLGRSVAQGVYLTQLRTSTGTIMRRVTVSR